MIPPAWLAAPASLCLLAAVWACNRFVLGFLPDDPPRPGRKQHLRPVPLAGVAIVPVLLVWLLAGGLHWLAGGVVAAAVLGHLDDRGKERGREPGWRSKAVVLAFAAAAAATQVVDPGALPERWLLAAVIAFVLANATNFLDNTDGVAASLAGASLLCATGGSGPLAACGFAALGFLPWNWPRPVLFLGDGGALALGLCGGAVCAARLPGWPALLPFAVQFADFVQVVVARLWIGVAPWIGDRRHLTHIVQNLGLPRVLVAPLFAAAAVGIAAAGAGWIS